MAHHDGHPPPELQEGPSLSDAIVVWTGWGETSWPRPDERRLVERYGEHVAADLLPRIRQLTEEFYASDAKWTAPGLKEMGALARERFRTLHPEISPDAIQALAWCYTFDNR